MWFDNIGWTMPRGPFLEIDTSSEDAFLIRIPLLQAALDVWGRPVEHLVHFHQLAGVQIVDGISQCAAHRLHNQIGHLGQTPDTLRQIILYLEG